MLRKDDEELLERYQGAWVDLHQHLAAARDARAAGYRELLTESSIPVMQGRLDAVSWLIGMTPVTPLSQTALDVTPETVRAEESAARDAIAALPGRREPQLPLPVDAPMEDIRADPGWVAGVGEILSWYVNERQPA